MVNVREKLPDIAFQNPRGSGVIFAGLAAKRTKSVYGSVRSLADTAGIRISDKSSVKKWVELPVNRVVEQAISYRGFMDISRFRVGDVEGLIRPVPVCLVAEFGMEE